MMHRVVAGIVLSVCAAAVGRPPVFAESAYSDAKAEAAKAEKLFVVDATAEWCGPCKQMDRTTWVDERVTTWLGANAIAVQVDVDEQRAIAASLKIQAMPTVIAFKGDQEIDRVVGYRSPDQLLTWLEGARGGKSRIDTLIEAVKQQEAEGKVDVRQRLNLARELASVGRIGDAAEQYAWLWGHMVEHDPSMVGLRVSFMAGEMERLAEDPAARQAFTALRDRMEVSFENNEAEWEELGDWVTLNEIIGDEQATLAWIDRTIGTEIGRDTLARFDHLVGPLLIRNGRWADFARIQVDPLARLRTEHQQIAAIGEMAPEGTDPQRIEQVKEMQREQFRRVAGLLHASLLAAGNDELAWQIADTAISLDGDARTRFMLVSTAIAADEAEARHRDFLDPEAHAGLLERLNQEIEAP